MLNLRILALSASLVGAVAAPAFAQITQTPPASTDATPMPDTGLKKTAVSHAHKSHRHTHAVKTTTQVPMPQRG